MMDLAYYAGTDPTTVVRRSEISRRQGIPTEYLDQIMIRLRAANLVDSVRGRSGGYRLGRGAAEISLWAVFASVEDSIYPVECVASKDANRVIHKTTHGASCNDGCGFESSCITRGAWSEIFDAMRAPLLTMTLATATTTWAEENRMCPVGGIRECRGG